MGNQVCCEETRTHSVLDKQQNQIIKHPKIVEPPKKVEEKSQIKPESVIKESPRENIETPKLTQNVQQTLKHKYFFKQEQQKVKNPQKKRYGKDVYEGELDQDHLKPNGFGKMYKSNNSLYIGHFSHGKAQGKGAFIFEDGSYYEGDFVNNCAESKNGYFLSEKIEYTGGFKHNTFEGQGIEKGKGYAFQGQYHNGARHKGTLQWNNENNSYTGSFNQQGQFHGKGNLKEPEGTYEGDFLNGEKHGKGIYHFSKGSRYEGEYVKGFREGQGTIYHGTGQIAYTGNLKKGLPHGKGSIYKDGKMIEANWVEGIDANLLPQ